MQLAVEDHWNETIEYARDKLRHFQEAGIKRVRISTAGESSCPACRKQSKRIFMIDEALKEMPIPCKDCTFDLHGVHGKVGWCRCVYIAEL